MNPVVHWELFATDALALARFYEALFGWVLQPLPEIAYVEIDTCAGGGINGGIASVPDGSPQPMFYVSADDLESTLDHVHQAGGTTTLPPLHEMVTFAQFADPEGNVVGLVKSGDEPSVSDGDAPAVSRFHLSATDPDALVGFYRQVFGWRAQPRTLPGDAYGLPGRHRHRWNPGRHRDLVARKTGCDVLRHGRRPAHLRRARPSVGRSSRSDRRR